MAQSIVLDEPIWFLSSASTHIPHVVSLLHIFYHSICLHMCICSLYISYLLIYCNITFTRTNLALSKVTNTPSFAVQAPTKYNLC